VVNIDARELGAALLWLRNHYDVGRPEVKSKVLKVIDKIIDELGVTMKDMERFRNNERML
jgi:hypothetical protein